MQINMFWFPGPFTWISFNIVDNISKLMAIKEWDEITYAFPNFNYFTFEVMEQIGNYIPYIIDVIT